MSKEQDSPGIGRCRFRPYPKYKDSGVEWLGKIPAHWESKPLKYAAPLILDRIDEIGLEIPYIGLENIESSTGKMISVKEHSLSEEQEAEGLDVRFRSGDVLFGKLRPYLAKVLLSSFDGRCSSEFLVLRSKEEIAPAYLAYQLISQGFIARIDSMTYGIKMPRASPNQVMGAPIAIPDADEQSAISTYLDSETAKVDALIEKKERLIELLQEKRTALITHAVTKGLDPAVPMKDSDVGWLGQIPVHWEVKPFTKYTVERSDYRGKTPEKVISGVFLVTARNVRMGLIDYECSQEFIAREEYDKIMRRGLPKKGDILFTTEAPLGNVAIIDREDIALAQRIIRFRMNSEHFDSRFALYAMISGFFQAQLLSLATGSTAEGIKASKLPMLRLCAPDLIEQNEIVSYLDRETSKIDMLVAKIGQAIDRLREYRMALISAAVTGKIDVQYGIT